jgi:AraC family transcriptional regulator
MIGPLNALADAVEKDSDVDVPKFAHEHGTTEYHLRRMFSALAGMPLSEYIRRRRMTLAGAELVGGASNVLEVAVRHGYGSVEAFGRAFRAVHGIGPSQARRNGGPLHTQPTLRFRLSVEGRNPMDVTIRTMPELVLAGHAAEVPLIHEGANPHIQAHVATIPPEEHVRLKALSGAEPKGILAVTGDIPPDAPEGTGLTYLHGVSLRPDSVDVDDLDVIHVEGGKWAVFSASGPFPETLQGLWAATAAEWFPSNPWRLRPGPSIVRYLEFTGTHASCELWLAVEQA